MNLINANKPHLWKRDIAQSVDTYNKWFINFAPETYRTTRRSTTQQVIQAFEITGNLTNTDASIVQQYPAILSILRMCTAPPLARDRLTGLSNTSAHLIRNLELKDRVPPRMPKDTLNEQLESIANILNKLLDQDLFPWLQNQETPDQVVQQRAATVVADRLCGTIADPIIRNAQERRQLTVIKDWLETRGYQHITETSSLDFRDMPLGSFAFRLNLPVTQPGRSNNVNISIDAVIQPQKPIGQYPLLIEAKSAGDYTNPNKRRKEEATKVAQLQDTYGMDLRMILFLCGYFDSGYLGYEAAEGLDWVWEHRIDDLGKAGL